MADFEQGCAWIEGEYVALAEAKISLFDWGFLHSDATYDVAHVWQGRFFRLCDHIARFEASMAGLRMSIEQDRAAIETILSECVRRSGLRDAYVEMICTRGQPAPGSRDPRTCRNRFFAFAIPFIWIADLEQQNVGLHLHISDRQRIPPEALDPRIKNYHWLDMVMAQYDAYDDGADNVVLVDARGNLVEGPGFNVFVLRDGTISTPARGMLEGITRRTAIELAERVHYVVVERDIPLEQASDADEIFITSTAGGVMPVTRLNGEPVDDGLPGDATMQLRGAYWDLHRDPTYSVEVDY